MITIEIPQWFAVVFTIYYGICLYPQISKGAKLIFDHLIK